MFKVMAAHDHRLERGIDGVVRYSHSRLAIPSGERTALTVPSIIFGDNVVHHISLASALATETIKTHAMGRI